jgi:hypothetical protein
MSAKLEATRDLSESWVLADKRAIMERATADLRAPPAEGSGGWADGACLRPAQLRWSLRAELSLPVTAKSARFFTTEAGSGHTDRASLCRGSGTRSYEYSSSARVRQIGDWLRYCPRGVNSRRAADVCGQVRPTARPP